MRVNLFYEIKQIFVMKQVTHERNDIQEGDLAELID
jgi:hypothetical protein